MAKRPGPKPKPKALDDLDGNPSNRPKPDPVKASGEPNPPEWLGDYAKEIWHQVIASMPPNFYASADEMILASYCQAANMARRASIEIEEKGITITNAQKNVVRNPASAVLSDAMAKITSIGNNLGLDPSARQAMGITAGRGSKDGKEKPSSKFGQLISINGDKK